MSTPTTSTAALSSPINPAIQAYHTNWVRTAELTLKRLQASIDAVHLRLHANQHADTGEQDQARATIKARIQKFNARVTRSLMQVWYVELNGLIAEQMEAVGLGILVLVSEWEGYRESLERSGVPKEGVQGEPGEVRGAERRK